jgi:catechol 2,3-dioxygenase-like lactoylglutathione lyase family enzyme
MQIEQALHVAIAVTDLDRAATFYGEVLGLPQADRPLKFPGLWYQVGAFQIHLIQCQSSPESSPAPTIAPLFDSQRWGRNPHLAFAVSDVAAIATSLETAGYAVQHSASGRSAIFVRDPDGNLLEFSQVAPLV